MNANNANSVIAEIMSIFVKLAPEDQKRVRAKVLELEQVAQARKEVSP